MRPKISAALTLASLLIAAAALAAQSKPVPYPHRAPVAQYLMPRAAEIALARSAAPASVSGAATVLVLSRHGYETAAQGTNGFVCYVERSWMSPFHSPDFWNPKIRGANCVNPAAGRSVLPYAALRTRLVLAGLSQTQVLARLKAAIAAHQLPPLEPGAMAFMMSRHSYLGGGGSHDLAHLMFYTPVINPQTWGANLPGSPVGMLGQLAPAPIEIYIVPTRRWSDGTPASL